MFWNEDESPQAPAIPDDILDVRFEIDCRRIPVDHAHALASALRAALPWVADEPDFAPHSIHVAGSQNGWERPEHGRDSVLLVSRRTRLVIRVPKTRVERLLAELPGARLDLGDHALTVGRGAIRPLSRETTVFARYLTFADAADAADAPDEADPDAGLDESAFLETAARALAEMDIRMRKALCGRTASIFTPEGPLRVRSLLLAGLTPDESLRLQQRGLGTRRLWGCGIFIPHKGIAPVKPE